MNTAPAFWGYGPISKSIQRPYVRGKQKAKLRNARTADRHPDYAILSEGQEHKIRVDAERVVFAGGEKDARRIDFVFPGQAIWVEDIWGSGDKGPYPAPMVLLTTLLARRGNDAQAYDEVVVPFLDRVIMQFPVLGYPPDPPAPILSDLLKNWSVVVRFGDRFERVYRRGDSSKTLVVEFQGV